MTPLTTSRSAPDHAASHHCDVAIVGGGISGLGVAWFLKARRPELEVRVLEKAPTPGGKARSSAEEGYVLDWGPNGFLTNVPDTLELVRALGLEPELQAASEAARHRYLYLEGALKRLPTSPPALLASDLLLPSEKLAALKDLFARPLEREETVHNFVARHFGLAVAERFAGPLVLGITAGDAREVSLDALFPRMRELERLGNGSLLRALFRQRRESKGQGLLARLMSFRGGVQRLVDALAAHLGEAVRCSVEVVSVIPHAYGYALTLSSGETLTCTQLILATPAYASAKLLEGLFPEASRELAAIPYADVRVLGFGFDRIDVPNALDGFGFLVPRGEGVRSLGVLYSSSLFPDQAPPGKVLLRVIAGGRVDPGFAELSEDEAVAVVRRELARTLHIVAEPEFVRVVDWPRGIPQYLLGHRARVERVMGGLPATLHLTGNAYYGVGLNDCVRDAKRVAGQVAP
jgi:oxygen-dependent protoporphyrinogen oxidase